MKKREEIRFTARLPKELHFALIKWIAEYEKVSFEQVSLNDALIMALANMVMNKSKS